MIRSLNVTNSVVLAFLFLLSSCALVYKTSSIEHNVSKITDEFNTYIRQSRNSLKKIDNFWGRLAESKTLTQAKDYKKNKQTYDKLTQLVKVEFRKDFKTFESHTKKTVKYIREKDKIQKSDPRYKAYEDLRTYIENASQKMKTKSDQANKLVHQLNAYIKSLNIYDVNPKKLKKDVQKELKKMKKQSGQVSKKLKELETVVKKYPKEERVKRQRIIKKLYASLGKINSARTEFDPILTKFEKETAGAKKKMIVMPGMASHSILGELKKLTKKVQGHAKEFNQGVSALNALNKK